MFELHWASPLPPAPTDIGAFTERLLPALRERSRLTLWYPRGQPAPRRLADDVPAAPFDGAAWRAINRGTAAIWNLGNDARFHGDYIAACRAAAGVVILHDTNMLETVAQCFAPDTVRAHAAAEHGAAGARAAAAVLRGRRHGAAAAQAAPMLGFVARHAMLLIVHSASAARQVSALPDMPPIRVLSLPYPAGRRYPRPDPMRPAKKLILFGYLAANRQLPALIEMLSRHPAADRFTLHLYGEIQDRVALEATLIRCKAHRRVTLHGFVDDETLDQAIADADLAINLRRPSMGEASGAQLRVWNQGVPSVVSDAGWYAELPDDAVIKLPPDDTGPAFHAVLDRLLGSPEDLFAVGEAGRQRLETAHRPADYVDHLLRALDDLPRRQLLAGLATLRSRREAAQQRLPALPETDTLAAYETQLRHRAGIS